MTTILLSFKGTSEKNVQILINLSNEALEDKFKKLMDEQNHSEAFDLIYSKSEHDDFCYLDPSKVYSIKPPEYILVEDLITKSYALK